MGTSAFPQHVLYTQALLRPYPVFIATSQGTVQTIQTCTHTAFIRRSNISSSIHSIWAFLVHSGVDPSCLGMKACSLDTSIYCRVNTEKQTRDDNRTSRQTNVIQTEVQFFELVEEAGVQRLENLNLLPMKRWHQLMQNYHSRRSFKPF